MGTKTGIEWTDATWNPIMGCSRVSEGCRNCYAESIAGRFGGGKETVYSGLTQIVNGRAVWTGEIKETKKLLEPLSWRSPKLVFVNSMSDLFHENVSDEQRDKIFAVMALCPQHTFQVLTKRPEQMLKYFTEAIGRQGSIMTGTHIRGGYCTEREMRIREATLEFALFVGYPKDAIHFPLPNVWLGVSVENQKAADERVPLLLQTPAAVRFVSCEPLLGSLRLDRIGEEPEGYLNALAAVVCCDGRGWKSITGLDWVIVGGESGPGARPMHPDWARSLRDQCAVTETAFFFKQWGEWVETDGPHCRGINQSPTDLPQIWMTADGAVEPRGKRDFLHSVYRDSVMRRVGKKAAGSLLDGVEHKNFPEAVA